MLRTVGAVVALLAGPCALVTPTSAPPPPQPAEVTCAAIGCPRLPRNDCERLPAADSIRADGYEVDCDSSVTQPSPQVRGWTDHDNLRVVIWPDGLTTEGLTKLLDHEHGHVLAELRGLVFADQAAEEDWADGHSFCHAGRQNGIGYRIRPTPAECSAYL